MNSTFKKVALASALLASSALVAPQAAFAAASAVTTAGTTSVFNAPFTTAFQAPYNARVSISVTRDGTAGNSDGMELIGFLYDSSDNYVGFVRGGTVASAGVAALTDTVTLRRPPRVPPRLLLRSCRTTAKPVPVTTPTTPSTVPPRGPAPFWPFRVPLKTLSP